MTSIPALDWSADNCTVGRALDVLRDRATFLVLREVFNGVRRFDDMLVRATMPRTVLTDRLSLLVDNGLLRKVPYQEPGKRTRAEYRLTDKGMDLYPTLSALLDWGDRYLSDPEGSPLELTHRDCGHQVHTRLVCEGGHVIDEPREVVPRPGPGARRRTA